ncbi:acyltransferase [Mediterranea massiliensis]|uniref:acyltransferase n=1 Tax=Mediterranea massiliensis TaxID=1841865 RepID=UPI000934E609|nr:hypothetical protein [Mediterranea massiliensis]
MYFGYLYNKYKEKQLKKKLGFCGRDNNILQPCHCGFPQNVYLDDYTLIQPNCTIIITPPGKFVIKKYSSISCNGMIVTGNHIPTVGLNQRIIGRLHINDNEKGVYIDEDCWCGANVTLLGGTHLKRGVVVGANSLVNKEIPPYAVVVGSPAKIIASKFTLEQIIEHEKKLYPESERMKREELEELFETVFKGKKSIGTDYLSPQDKERARQYAYMQYEL